MSGDKLFIDTNIALYLLSGDTTIAQLLNEKTFYISFITQLELLGYFGITKNDEKEITAFIKHCTIIDINNSIKEQVISLRKKYHLKLPDCIIMASSIYLDIPIITADADFKKVEEIDLLYYEKNS